MEFRDVVITTIFMKFVPDEDVRGGDDRGGEGEGHPVVEAGGVDRVGGEGEKVALAGAAVVAERAGDLRKKIRVAPQKSQEQQKTSLKKNRAKTIKYSNNYA